MFTYRVEAVADAGIRYIKDHKDEPFFLMMSYIEPHFQNHRDDYPAPLGYEEMYTGRWTPPDLATLGGSAARHLGGYRGMVKRLDEAYGCIMDSLVDVTADLRARLKARIKAVECVDVEIELADSKPAGQRYKSNLRSFDQWRM